MKLDAALRNDADMPNEANMPQHAVKTQKSSQIVKRFLPLCVIAFGLIGGYIFGLHENLSLSALAEQRENLQNFVADHLVLAAALYFVIYILAVAFSFPAASILTIFGGFLFGWFLAGLLTAFAATIGATILFKAAQTAFGDFLRARAGPFAAKLSDGFKENAFSYLVVLRLAPIFPFFIMNILPALFNIPLRTYMGATMIGILPGTFAYTYLGQGVDSVLATAAQSGEEASITDLVTPDITVAFAVLALVAAIPPIVKKLRQHQKS